MASERIGLSATASPEHGPDAVRLTTVRGAPDAPFGAGHLVAGDRESVLVICVPWTTVGGPAFYSRPRQALCQSAPIAMITAPTIVPSAAPA